MAWTVETLNETVDAGLAELHALERFAQATRTRLRIVFEPGSQGALAVAVSKAGSRS